MYSSYQTKIQLRICRKQTSECATQQQTIHTHSHKTKANDEEEKSNNNTLRRIRIRTHSLTPPRERIEKQQQ